MKIIQTDNFGGDYPDECFVEGLVVFSDEKLKRICAAINAELYVDHPRCFRVVDDDYKLQPGFEP